MESSFSLMLIFRILYLNWDFYFTVWTRSISLKPNSVFLTSKSPTLRYFRLKKIKILGLLSTEAFSILCLEVENCQKVQWMNTTFVQNRVNLKFIKKPEIYRHTKHKQLYSFYLGNHFALEPSLDEFLRYPALKATFSPIQHVIRNWEICVRYRKFW